MDNSSDQDTIGLLVHSYNNYLAGIMGFTELALMDCEQAELKERLQLGLQSGKEAVLFGKQLLSSVSRLHVQLASVDLAELVRHFVAADPAASLALACSGHNDGPGVDGPVWVRSDREWLLYCLGAIVQFCRDFSADCKISLKLTGTDALAQLVIFATPLALSKEEARFLFQPFYSSRKLLGQKDVGLAKVKGFAEQMKGQLSWDETSGFMLTLPTTEPKV